MKKIFYTLLVLFVGIIQTVDAQQEASSIIEWNGKNKRLMMRADSLLTFSYKATENGTLYIYSDDQNVSDNMHVSIWGGWYHDGAYDADSPLQEAGSYENGVGIYAWIKVLAGDEIRFTLSTPEEAEGIMAIFTLKSLFFGEDVKGDSWEAPIALAQNAKTALPVYRNYDSDYLADLSYATFCRFVAPSDGVASIFTSQYLIYYIEEELYGSIDIPLQYATQDMATDDHEFVVKKDKAYIIIVPNSRPTEVTFKMVSDRLGENCKAPIELIEFPAVLDLVKGNNFYRIDLGTIGDKYIMELQTAVGWQGTITYLDNCDYETEELLPAAVNGAASSYIYNLDPLYMGSELIINFNLVDVPNATDAATISLREPKEGESFDKATAIKIGKNVFNGVARDYWFVYTSDKDAEISVSSTGTLKHMLYSRGSGNIINEYNVYRISEGQKLYMCVNTTADGPGSITLTEKAVAEGDYCDNPILFDLGEDIIVKDRGDNVSNFRQFAAEKSGFAILETTSKNVINNYWSIYFREDCDSKTISYVRSETTDASGNVVARAYKIPVAEGNNYLIEIMAFANNGADVVFTTRFEEANEGGVCATAIEINQLGDTIAISNTPETTIWYKYTADKGGFYTTYAKIGRGSNLRVKIGDCDSDEINASDDSRYSNAYMAGYKKSKVYVEKGETFYIGITINADPGDTDGTNYYIVPTFAESRPGERFADAIQAEPGTEYTLTTGINGYDTWYTYTLPAGTETTINISSTMKNYSSLMFYVDEKTSLSAYKKDFTQTNIFNEEEVMIGKNYVFPTLETDRTIYIKAPIAAIAEPVVWKIVKENNNEGEGLDDIKGCLVATVYPNPTDGLFYVNVPTVVGDATMVVVTLSGATVCTARLSQGLNAIDLRGQLSSGIYMVTINSERQVVASKLIVR